MSKGEMQYLYQQGIELLPAHMHDGINNYIEHGRETGGFLMALLMNDKYAWERADLTNFALKANWVQFLDEYLPPECHGSPLKVMAWCKMGGLDGYPDGAP